MRDIVEILRLVTMPPKGKSPTQHIVMINHNFFVFYVFISSCIHNPFQGDCWPLEGPFHKRDPPFELKYTYTDDGVSKMQSEMQFWDSAHSDDDRPVDVLGTFV